MLSRPLPCSPARSRALGASTGLSREPSLRFWCLGWKDEHHQDQREGVGAQVYRDCLFSASWVVGSHLYLELQVLSHLGRLEIVFLGNVPKEIRSTEMAAIPSELGVEQASEHSRVG